MTAEELAKRIRTHKYYIRKFTIAEARSLNKTYESVGGIEAAYWWLDEDQSQLSAIILKGGDEG